MGGIGTVLPLDEPLTPGQSALDWVGLAQRALELAAEVLPDDPEDAADVAQEAILKLLLIEHPPRSIEAWLRIVVARGAAQVLSRGELARGLGPEAMAGSPPLAASPEVRVFARQILARLPAPERRLLLLHGEGVSTRDLARIVRGRRVVVARRLRLALEEARRFAGAGVEKAPSAGA